MGVFHQRKPKLLGVLATCVCVCAAVPLFYIVYHAAVADAALWQRLLRGRLPQLAGQTVALVAGVVVTTCVVGVSAAWLVERTDLPGRSIWRLLLSLPLAIPGYVVAVCYMFLLRRGGFVEQLAMNHLGFARGEFPLPPLFSLWGVTAIMSLYAFPFVFLAVSGSLRVQDGALEDAARVAGGTRLATFFRVTVPLLTPAIAGGVVLVGLYVFSDFGTVSLMRYQTFTTSIFREFAGVIGRGAASIMSLGLVVMILPLLFGQILVQRGRYTRGAQWRPPRPIPLGRMRVPALAGILLLVLLSLVVPVLVLSGLTIQSVVAPSMVDQIWGVSALSVWRSGGNSLVLATGGATLAVLLALFPAILVVRYGGSYGRTLAFLGKTAFALPGMIVGLGFLMLFIRTPIYATVAALVLALAFRLLPQTITLGEATLRMVPPSLEQAAQTAGRTPWATVWQVTVPLAVPGLLSAWSLAFVTAMKELPLLMMLRPPGFDTLPVRIWEAANDAVYTQAAPPALLLVVLTMCTLALVHRIGRFGIDTAAGRSAPATSDRVYDSSAGVG